MSWASKYIDRYIAKKVKELGMKGIILWLIGKLVKHTPSKEDDRMFAKVKKAMEPFK